MRRLAGSLAATLAVALTATIAAPAVASPPTRAATLIEATRAGVAPFENPAAARAAGYLVASVTGAIQHWVNPAYEADGSPLDPHRPAGLVYLQSGGRLHLVAAMFILGAPGEPDPSIPGAVWHHHTWCQGDGGIGFPLPGGPCPGETSLQTTPDMLHVWLAGTGLTPFDTAMDPSVECRIAAPSV